MFTRTCGLLVLCLCFAKVILGADPPMPPRPEPIPHAARQTDATAQPITGRPAEILCSYKFVELSASAAAKFEAAADLATPRSPQNSPPPSFAVYRNAEKTLRKLRESGRATIQESGPIAATIDKPTTTLLSGGEFPILIPTGSSNRVAIEWKKFGYRAEVVPHWLDAGRVQLQVTPEIATKDMKHAVVANGLTIPGLTTRRAYVRAEMHLGETIVVNFGSDPENEDEADNIPHAVTLFMVTPVAANSSTK
jgi:Bacterial type II and III secretion system protein